MAANGGNFSDNDFLDLEPVLDDDSFSLDVEVSDPEDLSLDSLVASAGDEYPVEKGTEDSAGTEFDSFDMDLSEADPFSQISTDTDLNSDMDLDLDLEIEDPILDEKINEIVEEEAKPIAETNEITDVEEKDDLIMDELETEDEPITLSLEELENITSDSEVYESESEKEFSQQTAQNSDTADSSFEEDFAEISEGEATGFTDEELDEILGKDLFEESDEDFSDEAISLSQDELNHIISSEDIQSEDFVQPESTNFKEKEESSAETELDFGLEDAPAAASDSSEENWDDFPSFSEGTSEEWFEPTEEISTTQSESSEIFGDEDIANEPITLSMDELSAITGDEDFVETPEPDVQDATIEFEDLNLGDENISLEDSALLTESEDNESLTLSNEELGNILGVDEKESLEESSDLTNMFDTEITLLPEEPEDSALQEFGSSETLSDEVDSSHEDLKIEEDYSDEPITLSPEELNDIIGEVPPGEDLQERSKFVAEKPLAPSIKIQPLANEEIIDLDEFAEEGKISPLEELRHSHLTENNEPIQEDTSRIQTIAEKTAEDSGLSAEDKKKVLLYLDNLLGNLPDDLIREFSKSSYFDLYKKLMKEIGV